MPSVTPNEIEIDESKKFTNTSDKAEQSQCHVYQGRNTKVNGEKRPGIAIITDSTEDNQRFEVGHPTGARMYVSPDGSILLKSMGDSMYLTFGNSQEATNGDKHIVIGGTLTIVASSIQFIGDTELKGNFIVDGNISCNNLSADDNIDAGQNITAGQKVEGTIVNATSQVQEGGADCSGCP